MIVLSMLVCRVWKRTPTKDPPWGDFPPRVETT